jgi:hypothetical protein
VYSRDTSRGNSSEGGGEYARDEGVLHAQDDVAQVPLLQRLAPPLALSAPGRRADVGRCKWRGEGREGWGAAP